MSEFKGTKEIKSIMAKIEKSKIIIGKERDRMRELYGELETILECLDGAKESFEIANQYFEEAIDKLSEQV
jgi:hypothetical protein